MVDARITKLPLLTKKSTKNIPWLHIYETLFLTKIFGGYWLIKLRKIKDDF